MAPPNGDSSEAPKWAQNEIFGSRGPNFGFLGFFKLVDLEISCRGPWLKNSELSYASRYGPGDFGILDPFMGPNLDQGHAQPEPGTCPTWPKDSLDKDKEETIRALWGLR